MNSSVAKKIRQYTRRNLRKQAAQLWEANNEMIRQMSFWDRLFVAWMISLERNLL